MYYNRIDGDGHARKVCASQIQSKLTECFISVSNFPKMFVLPLSDIGTHISPAISYLIACQVMCVCLRCSTKKIVKVERFFSFCQCRET
jgi:hypothetical protein